MRSFLKCIYVQLLYFHVVKILGKIYFERTSLYYYQIELLLLLSL